MATDFYTKAHDIAQLTNAPGQRSIVYRQQYELEKQFGYLAKALERSELLSAFRDSLYRTGQEMVLRDIEASYEKSIKDETIARLDAQNEANTIRLNAQQRYMWMLIAGLLILACFIALIVMAYRKLREANSALQDAIQQKNILLKEIHHRVKNNLQVISSLLKLQSGYIKDDAAIQAIAEGRSRVQSMALLHQNLYKEDNLTAVRMSEYFHTLIQGLFDTYSITPDKIKLHIRVQDLLLDVDTVVPLGLIANELISNALKHAFRQGGDGELFVSLFEEGSQLILEVKDTGAGDATTWHRPGFGTKLIQSLSDKLEADIIRSFDHGTSILLRINAYRKAA